MKTPRHSARREAGFSLLEMMIAVIILGVITSLLFQSLTAQRGGNRSSSVAIDTQETTRLVLDLISLDTRNAGMLVPREVAVASVDRAGQAQEDRFCVSDGSIFQIPAPGTANAFWDNLGDTFNGSVGAVTFTTLSITNSLDIERTLTVGGDPSLAGGSNVDFVANAGIIIANGYRDVNGNWVVTGGTRSVFCAKVTQVIPPSTIRIDVPPGANFTGQVTAVPAILYEVTHTDPGDFTKTLLSRNSVAISDQIEDLQIQYWVDSTPTNGSIDTSEWPLDVLDGKDTSRIRRVRIYALGRTRIDDNSGGTALARHHYPGMANRPPSTAYDNFEREVFVASVLPRNLFDYLENPNAAVPNVP